MSKRPEKTKQTKADFQEAFWRLYTQQPIEKITVGALCDRAGYNRATFYLHFEDTRHLLAGIEDELIDGMGQCVETCMKSLQKNASKLACIKALKQVIVYYERNKERIGFLLGPKGDAAFAARLKERLKPLWREYVVGLEPVATRNEQEVDLLLEYTLSGALGMIARWLESPGSISTMQMGHLVYDAAIRDVAKQVRS